MSLGLFDGIGNLTSSVNAGVVEFRLQIEGYATEWVTNADLIDEVNGPLVSGSHRKLGLLRNGLQIDETIFYDKGISENRSGITFKILDYLTGATQTFFKNPTFQAPIAATILATDTTASVQSGYGTYFTSGSLYYLGNETLKIASSSVDTLYLERGKYSGEIPFSCSYYFPDSVFSSTDQVPYISDAAISLRNRRVNLYAYTDSEITNNYNNKGNLIYRGIITSDLGFSDESATTYQFTTNNIIKVLEGNRNLKSEQILSFLASLKLRKNSFPSEASYSRQRNSVESGS